ncbi:hypothetical protein F2Q68_00044247 [Brassica cretica]|uniref:Uncharacterized protein n=1 Tax=Brassica cretica TaxID=69181 RepID=A0A8S9LPD9_BRACR|nr:hypothetical protein F2Q68_00044247 [Brassica cretica]
MAGDVGETNYRFFKSGEAAVDQEDKIVVPPRKEPKVEKKKKMEHEHESEFGEEKESKERKEKALKEIEMGNAAYKATVLYDLHGTISSYQSKATFVAYKQCSGNKMHKILVSCIKNLMFQFHFG